jgi:hypothetical protein
MQEMQEHLPACLRSDKFVGNEPPEYFVRGVDDCTELTHPLPSPLPSRAREKNGFFVSGGEGAWTNPLGLIRAIPDPLPSGHHRW